MINSQELRDEIKNNLPTVVHQLNSYLRGENVNEIKDVLKRVGRGGQLPHWYKNLELGQSMPNLDGKTIGSVIEMTLLGVLEKHTLKSFNIPQLSVNPAKGVDIPLLNLGVKSPSENYCTSEPFFSAYERILGNEFDALILLTDYQSAKKNSPPIRVQIIKSMYLGGSEIADKGLCEIARLNRDLLMDKNEAECKKMLQFLCYVNQKSWRGKALVNLFKVLSQGDNSINSAVTKLEKDFIKKEKQAQFESKEPIHKSELQKILSIADSNIKVTSIVNAANDWVVDNHKDFARLPNDNEWQRFLRSPLNGKIGLSFALQWRYSFGAIFK
ncbi:hypothetical protein PSECIP111951_02104 [Pseudoalteromonas holothuriae]|uniref:Uncharacterized protein n=1 Tax=Pseudoalteromonas holothuriae TaxID=2963714 RepID=A0A9W4VVJ5_9GAMM|nr:MULTISPECIES: hypothetical protein [unclassified Pseudoalteromonas]CAH9050612.1 hypothetical protein PSECIP111854_00565 [Pseudoalteromonas sp. CIP111854]CAH9059604.1 hypothetical protein PSECIP111951_02104 [Pseudoalteromonas sp. CIP111951]